MSGESEREIAYMTWGGALILSAWLCGVAAVLGLVLFLTQ